MRTWAISRSASGRYRATACTLIALMSVLALHHVTPHEGSHPGDYCPLCTLLSAIVLVVAGLILYGAVPAPRFAHVRVDVPRSTREYWTPWSHRGPPNLPR